jgi:hypothetical protein
MQTTPDTDAAANVRQSVTRQVERIARELVRPAEFTEALTVAKHLREGDPRSAMQAHRAILRGVTNDLRSVGCADECFLALANSIHDYLAAEGYEFHAGRWQLWEVAPTSHGPRLVPAE